jgi:hypothetical protein
MITNAKKFQLLLNTREREIPNESYDDRFNSVANSHEGRELFASMHLSNSAVPVQSPRHAALLGRQWPIPDGEFRALWIEKFGPVSGGAKSPAYPSGDETRRRTAAAAGGSFEGDAKLKEEGRRGFLENVDRFMALGHNWSEAWSLAGTTSPGKEFFSQWARGAAQEKFQK